MNKEDAAAKRCGDVPRRFELRWLLKHGEHLHLPAHRDTGTVSAIGHADGRSNGAAWPASTVSLAGRKLI